MKNSKLGARRSYSDPGSLKESHPCPLCGSSEFRLKFKSRIGEDGRDPRRLYGASAGVPETQTIVACLACGMIYENPRHRDSVILQGYQSSFEMKHDSQFDRRVSSFLRALNRLRAKLPRPGARVLDIGTAGGAFLLAAKQFGYDAQGIEPCTYLASQARARGLKVRRGTLDSNPFPRASFDLITLWDVIEHAPDPRGVLSRVAKLLRPGGTVLINYPDIGTFQARLAGRRFWWIISGHLHHFSRKTIGLLANTVGLTPVHYRRYWQTLELGYLLQMAHQRRFPLASAVLRRIPSAFSRLPIPYYASQTTVLMVLSGDTTRRA